MDTEAFVDAFDAATGRFLEVLEHTDPQVEVPSCPGWSAADLLWHLAEVQGFWAEIVGRLLQDPSAAVDLERPADGDLHALAVSRWTALRDALTTRAPTEPCWSWSDLGGDVAWVARRQAHEALIHRVDAELTAGVEVVEPAPELAADGVDELVRAFLVGVPDWAAFHPDDATVALSCSDHDLRHVLTLGRMTGTSPNSGRTYDLEAAELGSDPGALADAEIVGRAWDLDRWLWGRGGLEALHVSGDRELVTRLRATTEGSTQ